ncbi:MAG TPA: hypothetical protein PK760_11315, partial [Flavobacteriales bacterium]|nr:hypothetical protein [Flavobacteriales bacterium]
SILVYDDNQSTANAGADQQLCAGNGVQLNASGGNGYSWSPAADLSDASIANPVASPTADVTYVVTVTNANNCVGVDSVTISVSQPADPGADASATLCASGIAFTMIDSLAGTPNAGGNWFTPGGVAHSGSYDPATDPAGDWTYIVAGTGACPDTTATLTISTVTPPVALTGDNSICIGDSTQISATAGYASYSWSPTTGIVDATVSDPIFLPITTTPYTVTVSDANGCIGSNGITITVNALPTVNAGSNAAICEGQNHTIGGSPTSPTATGYQWSPNTGLSSSTVANPVSTPGSTITYTVVVVDANQCSNSDDVTITVNPLPSINAGPDLAVCTGSSVTIDATGVGSFSWSPATGLSSTTVEDPVASPTTTQNYTVTLTDGNNCVNTDNVTVTVNPLPTVDAGIDAWLCLGSTTTLTGTTSGGNAAWSPSSTVSNPNALSTSASPLVTTTYTLTITDANNCAASDAVQIAVGVDPPLDAGSGATVCGGVPVQLGGSPTSVPGSTYSWSPATGLNDPTSSNPTA